MGAILVIVGCSRRSKKSSYQNDTIDTSNLFFMTDLRGYFFVSLGRPKHHQLLIIAAVVLMTSIPASGEFWFTRMGMWVCAASPLSATRPHRISCGSGLSTALRTDVSTAVCDASYGIKVQYVNFSILQYKPAKHCFSTIHLGVGRYADRSPLDQSPIDG